MSLQTNLLDWFAKNQRPLPWRRHYRPYEVWVSEIMLQQTQVETMLPYFGRWIKVFPDVKTLAKSPAEKVLKTWQGLGYYSRARNLHETAKAIAERHGGKFPSDFEAIRALKGVGRYTAGAIASIAFNQERPIVDGNVLRVLSRVYAIDKPIDDLKHREAFWELQEKLIPKGHARDFNQALMELGALVCARNPLCGECPISGQCRAYRAGNAADYPVKGRRKTTVKVNASAVIVENAGKYLIRRRPEGSIMGGLWEFPEWKLSRDKKLGSAAIEKLTAELMKKEFGAAAEGLKRVGKIKRNYTHHDETLHIFGAEVPSAKTASNGWPATWVTKKDFRKYPFSSAHSKIADLVS